MDISRLDLKPLTIPENKTKQEKADVEKFGQLLEEKLQQVNNMQLEADKITEQFLAGDVQELHQVMIAAEKANLALQLTVEVRNKLIEAYQELYRMQI